MRIVSRNRRKCYMVRYPVFLFILFSSFFARADLASGSLVVGTLDYNPPFEVVSAQGTFGFDIDIMRAVCTHANLTCTFKGFVYGDLFLQIETGGIDLAIATIITSKFIQPEDFILSTPYLPSLAVFLVRKDSSINSIADLKGKVVATVADPLFETYLYTHYENISTIFSTFYTKLEPALNDLQSGKIDALLFDKLAVDYWVANNSKQFKSVGESVAIGFGYAIMMSKNNVELMAVINKALADMEKDGSYLELYRRYFGQ